MITTKQCIGYELTIEEHPQIGKAFRADIIDLVESTVDYCMFMQMTETTLVSGALMVDIDSSLKSMLPMYCEDYFPTHSAVKYTTKGTTVRGDVYTYKGELRFKEKNSLIFTKLYITIATKRNE